MTNPLLFEAIRNNNYTEVKRIIEQPGFDLDVLNHSDGYLLQSSSFNGRKEICALLIQKGADVNIQDQSGFTALYWASYKRYSEICALLIYNGANIDLQSTAGHTAVNLAPHDLQKTMIKTAENFQILCDGFDNAVTSNTVSEWDVPNSDLALRCAIYRKHLQKHGVNYKLYEANFKSFLENNLGRDIASTHPTLNAIFSKEMKIYSHNCHKNYEFFKGAIVNDIYPNLSDDQKDTLFGRILTKSNNAKAKGENLMTLIFSYLEPSDIEIESNSNTIPIDGVNIAGATIEGLEDDF